MTPVPVWKQWAKLVIELGPLAVFFVLNSRADIFVATQWFVVAAVIAFIGSYRLSRRLPILPLVSTVFVVIFGVLTIYLADDFFIKIKPTLVNTLFGVTLLGGLAAGVSLLRYIFADFFHLEDRGWWLLTVRWGVFFLFLALVNEIVWRNFSTEFWAGFKLFGIAPMTMIFGAAQLGVLQRYEIKAEATDEA